MQIAEESGTGTASGTCSTHECKHYLVCQPLIGPFHNIVRTCAGTSLCRGGESSAMAQCGMLLLDCPVRADLAQRVLKKLKVRQKQTSAGASKAGQRLSPDAFLCMMRGKRLHVMYQASVTQQASDKDFVAPCSDLLCSQATSDGPTSCTCIWILSGMLQLSFHSERATETAVCFS